MKFEYREISLFLNYALMILYTGEKGKDSIQCYGNDIPKELGKKDDVMKFVNRVCWTNGLFVSPTRYETNT